METTYRVEVTPTSNNATAVGIFGVLFNDYSKAVDYFLMVCCELDATIIPDKETLLQSETNWLCDAHNQVITLEIIFS